MERTRTLEATVAEDVAKIADPLDLDRDTRSAIERLTLESFQGVMAELDARPLPAEEADRLLAKRSRELHERIVALLVPSKQARYRELVGLRD